MFKSLRKPHFVLNVHLIEHIKDLISQKKSLEDAIIVECFYY